MQTQQKSIVKMVIYVLLVILIIWAGFSFFGKGGSSGDSTLGEVSKTGFTATSTDAALITELKSATITLPEGKQSATLSGGSYTTGKKGSIRQVVLGNIALSKNFKGREDVFAFIQDGRERAVSFAYLLHFVREDGSLKFVESIKLGAFSDVTDIKTIDINNSETGEEYSVVLRVVPYMMSSTATSATDIHFSVAMVNGKFSADTVEIY